MNFLVLTRTTLLFFAAIFLSCQLAAADNLKPITIGCLTDLTGKGAFLGVQSRAGAELAISELKAQGKSVKVIFGDHQLDAKTAISEAQKLLYVDKVDAVMSDFTPPSIAIASLVNKERKLHFYVAPISSILKENPFSFRNFLDYEAGCERIALHWKSQGITKIGKLKLNTEFGELCLQGAKKVFPELLVVDYNSGDDLKSFIATMKQHKIEAILQTAYEIDMLNSIKAAADIKYSPLFGVPEPLVTPLVTEKVGKHLEGLTAFGFPEISSDFVARIKAANPNHSLVNIETAAIAYTHVKQIAAALEACPSTDIDCQIESIIANGFDPTLSFKGWKQRMASYDYQLKEWKNRGFVVIQKQGVS